MDTETDLNDDELEALSNMVHERLMKAIFEDDEEETVVTGEDD